MGDSIKLFLIDDHVLMLDTLADRFDQEPGIVVTGTAKDAENIVAAVRRLNPDIILMDIDMPGLSCFEAIQRVKTVRPKTDIIILSSFTHDHYIDMAIQVKANGYLTKSEPFASLVQAVRRVANGRTHFSPSVESRIVATKDGAHLNSGRAKTRSSMLSPREIEVLQYLAKGTSKKDIAETMHVSIKTVDAHCQRLMNKLDIHDRVEIARFAIREKLTEA